MGVAAAAAVEAGSAWATPEACIAPGDGEGACEGRCEGEGELDDDGGAGEAWPCERRA